MTKKRKSIITDTGAVEYLPTDKGKMVYAVSWPDDVERPRGRPVEKDWQGVLRWLVAKAAEEGLPKGWGAQAMVEGWMQQWFIDRDLEASETIIKEQVRGIYEEVEEVEAGKGR